MFRLRPFQTGINQAPHSLLSWASNVVVAPYYRGYFESRTDTGLLPR